MAGPVRRTGQYQRYADGSCVVSRIVVVDTNRLKRRSRVLNLVVFVDNRTKRLEDDLRSQRRDIEVLGHQAMGYLALFPRDGVGECRREASDTVVVDVGVDIAVCLASPDGVDQRRRNRILAIAGGRRDGQTDLVGGIPPGLFVMGNPDNASVD